MKNVLDWGKVQQEGYDAGVAEVKRAFGDTSSTKLPWWSIPDAVPDKLVHAMETFVGADTALKILEQFNHLPEKERRKAIKGLIRDRSRDVEKRGRELEALKSERTYLDKAADSNKELIQWLSSPMVMQRPVAGATRDLRTAMLEGRAFDFALSPDAMYNHQWMKDYEREIFPVAEVFLIEHDWATAFSKANDILSGDINLPYEVCCFEFLMSDRRVVIVAVQDGETIHRQYAIEATNGWGLIGRATEKGLDRQIAAICIALDAEVAETELIRAPHLKNSKGAQRAAPLSRHHVVILSRRARPAPLPEGSGGTHRSPRLHFRRGHWRHLETHKTWIKWMLVGDPDLGFIEKTYRL